MSSCSENISAADRFFSFSFDAFFPGLVSVLVLKVNVISIIGIYSLAALVCRLVDTLFSIPSWSILLYSGPLLKARYSSLRGGAEVWNISQRLCGLQKLPLAESVQQIHRRPLQSLARIECTCRGPPYTMSADSYIMPASSYGLCLQSFLEGPLCR